MRRALAVLAAVPLIFFAAACGSDTAATSGSPGAGGGATGVKVTGNLGAKPTVTISGAPATKSSYQVIAPGTGRRSRAAAR